MGIFLLCCPRMLCLAEPGLDWGLNLCHSVAIVDEMRSSRIHPIAFSSIVQWGGFRTLEAWLLYGPDSCLHQQILKAILQHQRGTACLVVTLQNAFHTLLMLVLLHGQGAGKGTNSSFTMGARDTCVNTQHALMFKGARRAPPLFSSTSTLT